MTENSDFETWWTARGFEDNHPLHGLFKKISGLGQDVDLNFIFALCCLLGIANGMYSTAFELRRKTTNRKQQWMKDYRALFSSLPGEKIRLTDTARAYTHQVVRFTAKNLLNRKLIPSTTSIEFVGDDLKWIIAQAIAPMAKGPIVPSVEWNRAIDELGSAPNIYKALGIERVPPEWKPFLKEMYEECQRVVFRPGATKRRDDQGSFFLLFLTEHLRDKTGKPHFPVAFKLMRSLQVKSSLRINHPGTSANVRVKDFKKRMPNWHAVRDRMERLFADAKKIN